MTANNPQLLASLSVESASAIINVLENWRTLALGSCGRKAGSLTDGIFYAMKTMLPSWTLVLLD